MKELFCKNGEKYYISVLYGDKNQVETFDMNKDKFFGREWILKDSKYGFYFCWLEEKLSDDIKDRFNILVTRQSDNKKMFYIQWQGKHVISPHVDEKDIEFEKLSGVHIINLIDFLSSEFGLRVKIEDEVKERLKKVLPKEYKAMKEKIILMNDLLKKGKFFEKDHLNN